MLLILYVLQICQLSKLEINPPPPPPFRFFLPQSFKLISVFLFSLRYMILHCRMNNTSAIMRQMPPLPVHLNEELANTILPPPNIHRHSWFCLRHQLDVINSQCDHEPASNSNHGGNNSRIAIKLLICSSNLNWPSFQFHLRPYIVEISCNSLCSSWWIRFYVEIRK